MKPAVTAAQQEVSMQDLQGRYMGVGRQAAGAAVQLVQQLAHEACKPQINRNRSLMYMYYIMHDGVLSCPARTAAPS